MKSIRLSVTVPSSNEQSTDELQEELERLTGLDMPRWAYNGMEWFKLQDRISKLKKQLRERCI